MSLLEESRQGGSGMEAVSSEIGSEQSAMLQESTKDQVDKHKLT